MSAYSSVPGVYAPQPRAYAGFTNATGYTTEATANCPVINLAAIEASAGDYQYSSPVSSPVYTSSTGSSSPVTARLATSQSSHNSMPSPVQTAFATGVLPSSHTRGSSKSSVWTPESLSLLPSTSSYSFYDKVTDWNYSPPPTALQARRRKRLPWQQSTSGYYSSCENHSPYSASVTGTGTGLTTSTSMPYRRPDLVHLKDSDLLPDTNIDFTPSASPNRSSSAPLSSFMDSMSSNFGRMAHWTKRHFTGRAKR